MNPAVRMLILERWRRTWWYIAIMYAIFICAAVVACIHPTDIMIELFLGAAVMSLAGLGVGIPFSNYEDGKVPLGFLERSYRLPVRTWVLVTVHIGYALATTGLLCVLFLVSCLTLFSADKTIGLGTIGSTPLSTLWDVAMLGAAAVAVYAVFQMWCWIACRASTYIGLPLVLTGTYATIVCAFWLNWVLGLGDQPSTFFFASVAVLAFLTSLAIVRFDRRGGWSDVRARVNIELFKWAGRTKPFTSAAAALRWHEWRRTGYILPVVAVIGVVGLMLAPLHGSPVHDLLTGNGFTITRYDIQGAFVVLFYVPLGATACAGLLGFALRYKDWESGQMLFNLTRPVGTQALAAARIRTGLRSVLLTLGFLLAAVGGLVLIDHVVRVHEIDLIASLAEGRVSLGGAVLAITLGLYFALVVWTVYWLSPPLATAFVLVNGAIAVSAAVLIGTRGEFGGRNPFDILWDTAIPALGLPLFVATVAGLATAWRRKLLSRNAFVGSLCGLLACAAVGILVKEPSVAEAKGDIPVLTILALATLPWIPLASVPLVLHYQRHR